MQSSLKPHATSELRRESHFDNVNESTGVRKTNKKPRWKSSTCEPALIRIIREEFGGQIPRSTFDVRKLASLMPMESGMDEWCPATIKRHAVELERRGKI